MKIDYQWAEKMADKNCKLCGGTGIVEEGQYDDIWDQYCIECILPILQDREEARAQAQFEDARGN